ncbi:MAG: hypothetical protein E3J73_05245 [Candidatus Bathyarchaeum sp.]|nr:MAG: hypothetical protein E3J73_05245 [Candidatus Bathyarchaeum sp.]
MKTKITIKGRQTDQILFDIIRNNSGLSLYELSKKVKWKIGRVDGSVRRLLNSAKVHVKVVERDGRKVHLVYPKDARAFSDIIEVPSDLLKTSNPIWRDEAFLYALDNVTIGISGHDFPDWNEIACFKSKISIEREERGNVFVKLPQKFWDFYNLEKKHRVVSINGNNILVTVSGDIIETKGYPS